MQKHGSPLHEKKSNSVITEFKSRIFVLSALIPHFCPLSLDKALCDEPA